MRLHHLLLSAVVVAGSVLAVQPAAHAVTPTYYLSLGDSLSVGYQPGAGHYGNYGTYGTNQGYANDLYASLAATHPGLQLVQMGCSGETTGTMINGGICTYPHGSQLAEAEAFLAAHRGAVTYLTIDIGANDVDGCAVGGSINYTCVTQGVATITQNVPKIMAGLRAAGGYSGEWAGMSYYDPFLVEYLSGSSGQTVAAASVTLLLGLNTDLATEYALFGATTADVFDTFQSANFLTSQNVPGYGTEPTNVALICAWTWECYGVNNIHANAVGYAKIANAFRLAVL